MPLNYKRPVPTTFFHNQQCTLKLIFFPLQMGLLLTNAWRIESSSVRLYPSLRSWPFFWCVFHKRKPMGERVRIRFLHSRRALSRLPPLEGVSNTHWAEKQPKKPPATQAIFTLTAEHRHTAIWCQYGYFDWFQQKKAVHFVMRKPYSITLQPHCSDQPAYFSAISPSLKTTTQTNWEGELWGKQKMSVKCRVFRS